MSRPMLLFGFSFTAVMITCAHLGETAAFVVLSAAAAGLAVFLLVRRLRNLLQLPLICSALMLASLIFIAFTELDYKPAARFDGAKAFTGEVVSLPQISNERYRYDIKTESVDEENAVVMLCYSSDSDLGLSPGDCISVSDARIYIPLNPDDTESTTNKARGIYLNAYSHDAPRVLFTYEPTLSSRVLSLRKSITESLLNSLEGDRAGLLIAMLIGDKSYISPQTRTAYSNSGAAHLLAVSGLHVSLWVTVVMGFFALFVTSKRLRHAIGIIFLAFFAALTAFSPSVMRASFMYLLLLSSVFFGRKAESLNSLGFALLAITAFNPFAVLSTSLALSASAVFGVLTLGQYLCSAFSRLLLKIKASSPAAELSKRVITYIADIVLISVAVSITTLPVTVYTFGRLSLIAPVTNVLVIGLSFIAMVCGGIGAATGAVRLLAPVSGLALNICDRVLGLVLSAVTGLSKLTFSVLPIDKTLFLFWLAGSACIICLGVYLKRRAKSWLPLRAVCVVCTAVLLMSSLLRLYPFKSNVTVTVLPVNNGIAVLVNTGCRYALVGCGGSGYEFTWYVNEHMPPLPVTRLDLLLIPEGSRFDSSNYDYVSTTYSPREIAADYDFALEHDDNGAALTQGASQRYVLWDCVNIEYVHTSGKKCVIISCDGTQALISLDGENSAYELSGLCSAPDWLICGQGIPEGASIFSDATVIVSGSDTKSGRAQYREAREFAEKCFFTAYDGEYIIRM